MKNMAANVARTRERIVSITLTPLCNSDVLFDTDEVCCFRRMGEILVFIRLVYSQKINIPRRRS